MNLHDIETLFTYHTADHVSPQRFEVIREAAKVLGYAILENGGTQKDIERAIQKLRECVFFAIASLAVPPRKELH